MSGTVSGAGIAGAPRLPTSIFGRLRLLLAALFAVGSVVALAAAWLFSTAAATEAYDRLLVSAAAQIGGAIQVDRGRIVAPPPDSAFETLAQSAGDRFFLAIRAPDGRLLTGEPGLAADAAAAEGATALAYRNFGGARMRTATLHRFIAAPTISGWCSVVVAQTLDARHALVVRLMLKIGAIILFVAALGFAAALAAARRALLPFDHIGRALAARQAHDTAPLEVESPRETQALVETINAAFRRLDDRMAQLQNFAGIAAHQIRTPLTAIGAQAELLGSDRTAAARTARIDRLRANVATLSRLANQLLGQAMVSYRTERMPHDDVDLVELIRQVLRDAIPESLDRDLTISFEPPAATVRVVADRISLREALLNLVGNAVVHGAASLLRVRIARDGGLLFVGVADDGPGIDPALWERAALPFRLQREDRDGAGLGLSIAADVASAHRGRLAFARTPDGLFEVALGIADDAGGQA